MISLVVTHWNRFDMLTEALQHVRRDWRIGEILISDDASDDGSWEKIQAEFGDDDNVRLHRNETRLDCYFNKATAVAKASGPWVILFDSDNILPTSYLDEILRQHPWDRRVAYLPTFAQPDFDYRAFAGSYVHASTVGEFVKQPNFLTALNTANYFFHRNEYLRVWDGQTNPHTADSIYQNYRWLAFGNSLYFVPEMTYTHRIHPGSHFMTNHNQEFENFKQYVERKLREL